MFEWKPSYGIDVPEIDAQHQQLFALAGELHTAMSVGKGKGAVEETLRRLVVYTVVHFEAEEGIMLRSGYPDYAAHKAQHEAFVAEVERFVAGYRSGRTAMTVQLFHFLRDWLVSHIARSDSKIAPYARRLAA